MMDFVRKLMAETKLEPNEINEVLLVGGSSRLPIIQVKNYSLRMIAYFLRI
jgi:molecular chaperone DnaK (HSP70)